MNIVSRKFKNRIYGNKYSGELTEEQIMHCISTKYPHGINIFEHITNISCLIISHYIKCNPCCEYTLDDFINMNENFKEYINTLDIIKYKYLWDKLDKYTPDNIIKICCRDPSYIPKLKKHIPDTLYSKIFYANYSSIVYIPKEYHFRDMINMFESHYRELIKYIRHDLITDEIKIEFIYDGYISHLPIEIFDKTDFDCIFNMRFLCPFDFVAYIRSVNYIPIEYFNINIASLIIEKISPSAIRNLCIDKAYKIYSLRPDIIRYNYETINIVELWQMYPCLMKYIITLSTYDPKNIFSDLNIVKSNFETCSIKKLLEWCFVFYGKPFTKNRNNKRILLTDILFNKLTKNGYLIYALYNVLPDIKQLIFNYYYNVKINMTKIYRTKCLFYNYSEC
jgi:hypothetical protein